MTPTRSARSQPDRTARAQPHHTARSRPAPRTLSREELTAALAARQMLLERRRLHPAEAIARLTPLQGQHPPAPYIGLAARLEGFQRSHLERAIERGDVVKSTLMRRTLHLAATVDQRAYAQLTRQGWLRTWRGRFPHLDETAARRELRAWFREPRTNEEIRERVSRYEGVGTQSWEPVWFARTLLPLVQLPPAGFWNDSRRARFAVGPGRLPSPEAAAATVVRRYLTAFGPASRRDLAAWAGAAQRDFAGALDRVRTVSFRDEQGTELLDLPDQALPPAGTELPVRLLGHWDQPLLAYADRGRIIPAELLPLGLTLSGAPTVIVGGRVGASWELRREGDRALVTVTPHVELSSTARGEIREEVRRLAGVEDIDAGRIELTFSS